MGYKRLFESIRKPKNLFAVFFFSYLLILILSVMIGSISYLQSARIIKEQAGQYNYAMLEQAAYVVDGNLGSVQQLMTNITLDSRVNSFLHVRNPMRTEDLYSMSETIKEISRYKNTNNFIDSVYLYVKNIDSVLTHSTRYPADFFYEKFMKYADWDLNAWKEALRAGSMNEYVPEKQITAGAEVKNYIGYFVSLPIGAKDALGTAAVLVDVERVEVLLKKIDLLNAGTVYIVDDGNRVLMSTGNRNLIRKDWNDGRLTDIHGKYVYDRVDEEEVIISVVPSAAGRWKYVSVIPTRTFMHKVSYIKTITLVVILVECIMGLLLSYLLARRNYLPIKKAVDKLRGKTKADINAYKNELDFIEGVTLHALAENEKINAAIKQQKPMIRANTLTQIVKGNLGNLRNMEESLEALEIIFDSELFCVVNIHIDDYSGFIKEDSLEQRTMVKFVIMNVAEEAANAWYSSYAVDVDWNEVVLIMNMKAAEPNPVNRVYDIIYTAKEFLEEKYLIHTTVGIGSTHHSLEGISRSYRESIRALEYRMVRGKGSVIAYADIKRVGQHYFYPLSTETQMLNCVKTGETDRVIELLEDIFTENFKKNSVSLEIARCLFFDIMGTGLKVLNDIEVNYASVFGADFDPVTRITGCSTADEMYATLKDIYEKICRYIELNKKSHNDELKERILALIHRGYHAHAFCLTYAADALGINSSYLSYFFKEQTGQNFVDYLNRVRIDTAKGLLANTALSLAEIAGKIGYSNGGYFIRSFKKLENTTPGQYREAVLRGVL